MLMREALAVYVAFWIIGASLFPGPFIDAKKERSTAAVTLADLAKCFN